MARKSIRGLGANLYAPPTGQHDGSPALQHTSEEAPQGKATFYLSPQTLDELDQAWFTHRRRNRRVTKSSIVEQALKEFLSKTAAA